MRKHVKVSVIIPTYNRENLVDKAIKSVLKQTYRNYEVIIIDDGSTDNTEKVVKNFHHPQIHYIKHADNRGVSAARNTGIRNCCGEYIAFLDSDDEWMPEKLNKQMKIFEKAPSKVGAVYTGNYYIDKISEKITKVYIPRKKGHIYEDILRGEGTLYISTLLVRKECFTKAGLFDEDFPAREDLDMWIRISKHYQFVYVKDVLVICRTNHIQMTKNSKILIEGAKKIQTKYAEELKIRPYSYSVRFFYLGNKLCHIGKIKEGQRYFIKAIKIYPFCFKYYVYMLSSLFGIKSFMYFASIKKFLARIVRRHI